MPYFQKLGIDIKDQKHATALFHEIDTNKGGIILFDEFSEWAIRKKLDAEKDHE